jgi:membrane-associated phospholipid phosphatase
MDIKSEFKSVLRLDKRWSGLIRLKNLPAPIRKTSELLAHSGDSLGWWIALIFLWIIGNIFWKQWAVTIALGIAALAIVMLPLRRLVGRSRPIGFWEKKTRKNSPYSFPSGHAARAFLLAVLATGLGPAWLAVLFWIWAPLVSLARVAMGVHFLSDIIGGMLVAIIVGLLWLYFHEGVLQWLVSLFLRFLHIPLW